jgi:PAS domain S-box-containing protein
MANRFDYFLDQDPSAQPAHNGDSLLRQIIDRAGDALFLHDLEGKILEVNRQACLSLGYTREELIRLTVADIEADYPAQSLPDLWKEITRAGPVTLHGVHRRKDGVTFPVEIRLGGVEQGERLLMLASVRDITQRERAERSLAREAEHLAALYETSLEINAQSDVDVVLRTIVKRAVHLLGTDMGGLYLIDPGTGLLQLKVSHHFPKDYEGASIRLGEGLAGRVAMTASVLQVPDYQNWEGRAHVFDGYPFGRALGVPLRRGERILGVLFVNDDGRTGTFDEEEVRLLSLFAGQAAIAIDNAQMIQAERARAEEQSRAHALLTALSRVASKIERTQDPHQVMENLGQELREIGQNCAIALCDPQSQGLTVVYVSLSPTWKARLERALGAKVIGFQIPRDMIPLYRPLNEGRGSMLPDAEPPVQQLLTSIAKEAGRTDGSRAGIRIVGVPLIAGEEILGAMYVWGVRLEESDLPQYSIFGAQVASALAQARLLDETKRRATYLEAITATSSALRAATSRADMLPIILDQVLRHLGSDGAALVSQEEGAETCIVEMARGSWGKVTQKQIPAGRGLWGRVISSGQAYVTVDALHDPLVSEIPLPADLPSVAAVPLVVQQQVEGALAVGRTPPFEPEEIRLLTAIAEMAGNALHRAGLMETLEQRVSERTHDLEQANVRLMELDRLKSDFVSNVSHELRTPITNIMLYLDLLARASQDEKRANYVAVLRSESQRLGVLIDDLLTLSRLERGAFPIEMGAHTLDTILAEVIDAHRETAGRKKLKIHHQANPELPSLRLSRGPMLQVFTNLLANAVSYTPPEGTITFSSRVATVRGGEYVVVTIHNDGPPISNEDLPHIFDRFYRGKTGRESGTPGTGLGLSICKEIVERHGGWMEVETAQSGTAFKIWLPIAVTDASDGPSPA